MRTQLTTQTTRPAIKGVWLIFVGVGALFSGGLLAVPGLLWSRWLRPFSRPALVGYCLCWLSMTFLPIVLMYLMVGRHFSFEKLWPLVTYLFSAAIWLAFRKRYVTQPSKTVAHASFVAIAGALFLAPGVIAGGQIIVILPAIACIALEVVGWVMGGAVLPPSQAVFGLLMMIPVFLGHLAVYWPTGSSSASVISVEDEDQVFRPNVL
jgi:hypothetical protein